MIQSPAGYQGDVRIKRYLDFYQAGYGVAMLSSGVAFSPLSLFANGEQGGFYDFSDLSVMFQDAAGTTPVTAVEQPVGLVLDKRRGLVLGSELVTNPGPFTATTGWTGLAASLAVSSSKLRVTASGSPAPRAISSVSTAIGATYKVTAVFENISGSNGTLYSVRASNNSDGSAGFGGVTNVSGGTYTFYVTATATTTYVYVRSDSTDQVFDITSFSVRELPGSHLSQSTAAARPVLSARVNQLTHTEAFDNAAWNKTAISVSTNTTIAPSGAQTADTITCQSGSNNHFFSQAVSAALTAATYTYTLRAKYENHRWFLLQFYDGTNSVFACFDLQNKVVGTKTAGVTSSIEQVFGTDFYTLTLTSSVLAGSGYVYGHFVTSDRITPQVWTAAGTEAVTLWGADLRPANAGVGLPSYQRVGAATYGVTNPSVVIGNPDYDTTGFPLFLRFDGTDDFLQSSTITPGSVDKAQVFAGVRKLSDAAAGVIAELSADASANNGAFVSLVSTSVSDASRRTFGGNLRGTIDMPFGAATYTSPTSATIVQEFNIGGATGADEVIQRVNGVVNTLTYAGAGNAGTGNFGSYPVYVGSRGGTGVRLNGHLYSLILRFSAANLDAATITATETWVNGKTKAF